MSAPRFAVLLAVLFTLTAPTTRAQTPATTVKDSDENVVLQSNADGGLLAPGTFGTGTIPAEGAGTRLMWHPAKGAFRAGRVGWNKDGTQWDASNLGDYSTAFGVDTEARSFATTAMGAETIAFGSVSTAIGQRTTAIGFAATAMGRATRASGDYATATGFGTTASGEGTLSAGECNSASGRETRFVVGNGTYSLSSGECTSSSNALLVDDQGNVTISGTLTENSDRRLKTAIEPLGDGTLAKLSRLRPVRFAFKNQQTHPSGEQVGLIAQDVQKPFPALVSKGADGMLSLAYPKLTAVLVKGLQEQQAEIGRQQATIDSLERRVSRIGEVEQRLAALESQARPAAASWIGAVPFRGLALLMIGGVLGAGLLHLHRR